MADPGEMRRSHGLGPPLDGTQQRLDVVIALLHDLRDMLRPATLATFEPASTVVELREPELPTPSEKPARRKSER